MPKGEATPFPLVLDTHVWIWMMEGAREELSASTVAMIEKAGSRSSLLVSAISVWEVAMMEAKGRITLSRSIYEWVSDALTASGLKLVELSPAIAMESAKLPGEPHGDPADQIIMATARTLGATLVTRDARILAYGATGHLHVHNGMSA